MKNLLALALFAAACGKSAGPATDTVALGDSGFTIDVPKGWSVEVPMKGFYDFKANGRNARGAPQIMESQSSLGTLDEAVKNQCEGLEVTGKDALTGGYWITCKGESKMVKGVQTTRILVRVKKDDTSIFDCHWETDKDPAEALGICKSIKKKA